MEFLYCIELLAKVLRSSPPDVAEITNTALSLGCKVAPCFRSDSKRTPIKARSSLEPLTEHPPLRPGETTQSSAFSFEPPTNTTSIAAKRLSLPPRTRRLPITADHPLG